jgi:hypothetical protein
MDWGSITYVVVPVVFWAEAVLDSDCADRSGGGGEGGSDRRKGGGRAGVESAREESKGVGVRFARG